MLIRELLEMLNEDLPKQIELNDLAKAFPTKHGKAFAKLWGGDRLTYKGQQLFAGGELGQAYKGALKAVTKEMKSFEHTVVYKRDEQTVEINDAESQEVYMGWSEEEDALYIGLDVWLNDDSADGGPIGAAFDEMYKEDTGKDFDPDISGGPEQKAWTDFSSKNMFVGALFELSSKDGKTFTADLISSDCGGFYKSIYKSQFFKRLKLNDLRLD
jgi:hypothetical protein